MDIRYDNHNDWWVRKQAPRQRLPAIVRFERRVKEVWSEGQSLPCLIWQGSELFRVNDTTLIRPYKFIWELETGEFAPPGAWWAWSCPNEGMCCQWEHLKYKGEYCKNGISI